LADLGFCLCDLRPANILFDPKSQRCHLIDMGLDFTVWMDPDLVQIFRGAVTAPSTKPSRAQSIEYLKRGAACSKTRGVQLYLMLLLLHKHLTSLTDLKDLHRTKALVDFLASKLINSCVPLHSVLDLHGENYLSKSRDCRVNSYSDEEPNKLTRVLACRVKVYFRLERLSDFLLDYVKMNSLMHPECDGKSLDFVQVGGRVYSDDSVGCSTYRVSTLRQLDGRAYPCFLGKMPPAQYSIKSGEASLQRFKGSRPVSRKTSIQATPLKVWFEGNELPARIREKIDRKRGVPESRQRQSSLHRFLL
jgi:serine/threonine protein kinase